MKNRFLKGAHAPEKKVREIIRLFSDDLTATEIAAITGLSRITINAYLKMFRSRIAIHQDREIHFRPELAENKNARYYGIIFENDKILTYPLTAEEKAMLSDWANWDSANFRQRLLQLNIPECHALIDLKSNKLYHLNFPLNGNGNGFQERKHSVEEFWFNFRSRMKKFRGLNSTTIHLHIKESEFRFNNRNADLMNILPELLTITPERKN